MAAETVRTKGRELLFLIVSLFLAPMILLYFAMNYFEQQNNSLLLETARAKLMAPFNQLRYYRKIETFWCATLNEELKQSLDQQDMAGRIEKLARSTGEELNYIIWKNKKQIMLSNFLKPDQFKDWENLLDDAKKAQGMSPSQERLFLESRVRKLLGPHYLAEHFNRARSANDPHLIRPDASRRFPLVWLNDGGFYSKFGAIVLFKPETITRDHRLKLLANNSQHARTDLYHINVTQPGTLPQKHATVIKAACHDFIRTGREVLQYGKTVVAVARIGPNDYVANMLELSGYSSNSGRNTLLIALFTLFTLIITLRSKPGILDPGNISIRLQLLVLLFICSGIPLLVLALGALEHLEQQREHLIRSAYQSCIEFIQAIDLRSSGELSHIKRMSENAVKTFKELYKKGAPESDILTKTFQQLHRSRSEFRAAASSSHYLIAHTGVYRDGSFYNYENLEFHRRQLPIELKLVNDIGSYYLNFVNDIQVNPERYAEIELLTEMFYQKNLTEIVHELIMLTGNVEPMGWGSSNFPVFIDLISIQDSKTADFFFTAGFNPDEISRNFAIRQTDNLRRNEAGLSVFLYDRYNIFPLDFDNRHYPELRTIFNRVSTHPSPEPQRCSYAGEEWVFSGYQGNLLNNFSLLAMYPVSAIEKAIEKERQFIVYSALAALVILISLTLLFAHSFTVPVAHLQTAAEAVEKRDFAFKLPDLGHDEFGEMGRIFNRSIAELEELSLASIVQSRLMPAHTIDSGRFDVFGRSIPMADLGGDYYDYFSIDDNRFAVLLGDVAGHGVGASLIMAMAKAAVVCCKDFHDQPLQIINNLHRLISTTRSRKQRKVMTFQYLCFDKESGAGKYSNAGGCSPMLVSSDAAVVTEITLSGPVLGGLKNPRFSEAELQMQPGQALVLYTDGIIESKNPNGDEIGFDRFKQWLLDHYHADAAAYYHAVYEEYLRWLAGGEAQDDLTLIILVYQA
ncbi:MAG: hypothetical protein GQF41_2403 [Candidatus Rifleibacterium amylolyticum]|nr:MAG: hypothetical protein GQF41_2403 [Candidatus Rifleibacterium amylolyticum]